MTAERGDVVLITQSQLTRYSGSEMALLELVDHLTSRGTRVIVVAHVASAELLADLTASGRVEFYESTDPALDDRLRQVTLSYAWIQHQVIPESILRGEIGCPIVFAHLSGSLMIEFPLLPDVEAQLASVIAFNSQETLDKQSESGLLALFESERLVVLGNAAPDAFSTIELRTPDTRPVLQVISNHIPTELLEAVELLSDDFDVRLIGRERTKGAEPERVGPDLIADGDAVVSIGKTVQYALLAAKPVYCYDYFGGPGWLTNENVERARYFNFSGRGFDARSATEVANDIRVGFAHAREWATERRLWAKDNFGLAARVDSIERAIESKGDIRQSLDDLQIARHLALQELLRRYVVDWANSVVRGERLEVIIDDLRTSKEDLLNREGVVLARVGDRDDEISRLKESRDGLKGHMAGLEESRDRLKDRVGELDEERSANRREIAALGNELDTAKKTVSNQADEIKSLTAEVEAMRRSVAGRVSDVARRVGSIGRRPER